MQTGSLVVSIHDVSPLTRPVVEEMLRDLAVIGATRTSLLVIPNHHHQAPIPHDPAFMDWLKHKAADGHEVVAHGFFHRRPPAGGLAKRLVTESYTAGEGEFFDLSREDAAERLELAKSIFSQMEMAPRGFIAPAWLLGREAEQAVRDTGFEYTTRLTTFHDLKTGTSLKSQSLVWSVRAGWRRACSLMWNAFLFRRLADNPLMRVGLHPPDWSHPEIKAQCLKLIGTGLAGRDVLTYEEWLDRSRSTKS